MSIRPDMNRCVRSSHDMCSWFLCRNSKYFTRCQKSCETAVRKTKSHLVWHVTEFREGVGEDSSCPSCRIMFLACRILKSHPVWHVAYKNYLVWHVAEFGEGVGEHYPPTNLKERSTLITKLSTKEKYLYTNENLLHRHVLFHPIVNFLYIIREKQFSLIR